MALPPAATRRMASASCAEGAVAAEQISGIGAEQANRSVVRLRQPQHQSDRSGLTRSVGTSSAVTLPGSIESVSRSTAVVAP